MNRKGAHGQNDISIIIGQLPKRLQRKIAEEIDRRDGLKTTKEEQQQAGDEGDGALKAAVVPAEIGPEAAPATTLPIDFFMRKSAGHSAQHLEEPAASGAVVVETVQKVAESIPGILRLNATDASIMSKSAVAGKNSIGSRENGRRTRPHRSEVALRAELPISPMRHALRGSASSAASTPLWFDALDAPFAKELAPLYESLMQMMQRHVVVENWQTFNSTRIQLQNVFAQLLLQHLKFCCEQKVDTFFWKLLFYNVREYLKRQQSAESDRILVLIDEGLEFYTDLHAELSSKYLKTAAVGGGGGTSHKFSFIAKVAVQKLLICLGDLSRYKVKQLQLQDYAEAAKYYQRAQHLIPSNGIPYNQLAIVAIHARKKFDAIYFHMRSLMSTNAIHSARESLLVLFDEIRKKYEETELKTSPVHQHHNCNNSKSMRKEVWIHPDGVRRLHRTDLNGANKSTISEENRYDEMPADELLRRFTSLYLYVIGKLYTGIGMESTQEHQRKFLVHLNVVLKRNIFTRSRMLKMIALNIFVMEQNVHKDKRREIRYQAFNFCNQMFGLVLRKSNHLLTLTVDSANALQEILVDLNTLLQFIKIYTDWLAQNTLIWEPVRSEEHSFINCWTELEQLFPLLQRAQMQTQKEQPSAVLTLDEDNYLVGFTPLAATLAKQHYEPQRGATEILQFHTRSTKITNFEQCYEANRKRLAAPEESHFILEELNTVIKTALDNLKEDDYGENNSENIVVNGDEGADLIKSKSATELKLTNSANAEDSAQMAQLTKLKKQLEAKTNVKKMYNAKLEQILKFVDTKVYIEVRPKYLLPDTNCFIDCLEDFERLSREFKRYTLVIPLTVVKELDGLSKGVKLESYEKSLQKHRIHHFDDVSTCAKKSLDFIKTAKNNVKCATTKGSIINASLFALVEEEHVSNDDKILATALALSKTMCSETSSDGKCFIQTELVLITTDRNLRVKALSRNLAVSELSEFVQWAKDCNT